MSSIWLKSAMLAQDGTEAAPALGISVFETISKFHVRGDLPWAQGFALDARDAFAFAYQRMAHVFRRAAEALAALKGRITVEAGTGEVMGWLDGIDDEKRRALPKTFTRMWLSNVPCARALEAGHEACS